MAQSQFCEMAVMDMKKEIEDRDEALDDYEFKSNWLNVGKKYMSYSSSDDAESSDESLYSSINGVLSDDCKNNIPYDLKVAHIKPFLCNLCGTRAFKKIEIKKHIKSEHINIYQCGLPRCKFRVSTKVKLKYHIKWHFKSQPFSCDLCNWRSAYKSKLITHIHKAHENRRKLICALCEEKTNDKTTLRSHIKTKHNTSNPCTFCCFKTESSTELVNHNQQFHRMQLQIKQRVCHICGYKTKSALSLQNHIDITHNSMKLIFCNSCLFKTTRLSYLDKHMQRKHKPQTEYFSLKCEFPYHLLDKQEQFEDQQKRAHDEVAQYPPYCRSSLSKHLKNKRNNRKFICSFCSHTSMTKSHLKRHENSVHLKFKPYTCQDCEFRTTHSSGLKKHWNNIHNPARVKPFGCSFCPLKTSSKAELKCHTDAVHLKIKQFSCVFCDFKTNYKRSLNIHTRSIHLQPIKLLKCQHCALECVNNYRLKCHVNAVHNKLKPFICYYCGYKSATKGALKNHIETHDVNRYKKFVCKICLFKTAYKASLDKHIASVHDKVRPYHCLLCNYSGNENSSLKSHFISMHTNEKPYTCLTCGFKTSNKFYLKKHNITLHSGVKPYTCAECDHKTALKATLKCHIINVHLKIKPFSCSYCNKKFKSKFHVRRHLNSRVHKGRN